MRLMLVFSLPSGRVFEEHILIVFQILCSAFLQGADPNDLTRIYEAESKLLEPWTDSPGEISADDWRDYLSCREYVVPYMFKN